MTAYRDLPEGAISAITMGAEVGTLNVFRKGTMEAQVILHNESLPTDVVEWLRNARERRAVLMSNSMFIR